jgi:hypothetical protein
MGRYHKGHIDGRSPQCDSGGHTDHSHWHREHAPAPERGRASAPGEARRIDDRLEGFSISVLRHGRELRTRRSGRTEHVALMQPVLATASGVRGVKRHLALLGQGRNVFHPDVINCGQATRRMSSQRIRGAFGRVTQSVDHGPELPQYRPGLRHRRVVRCDKRHRGTPILGTPTGLYQLEQPVALDDGEPHTSLRWGGSVGRGPTGLSTSTSSTGKERADAARGAL